MTTKLNILKAIRQQCVECMGGQLGEIPLCTAPKCSLFPYRMGKDPEPNQNKGRNLRNDFRAENHTGAMQLLEKIIE